MTKLIPTKKEQPSIERMVKISHTQGVKQSANYQTGDVSFSVELYVLDEPAAIQKGLRRAENIVEDALGSKLEQMNELIGMLGTKNGKVSR